MNAEIEHEGTDEIVCPYCGSAGSDSWEFRNDEGFTQCGDCSKNFKWSRNVSVDYDTKKVACLNGGEPHDYRKCYAISNKTRYECRKCTKYEWRDNPTPESATGE